MSVYCKDCKYFDDKYFIGCIIFAACTYPDNIWINGAHIVLPYKYINRNQDCAWYKPSIKKRLSDWTARIKKRLLYYLDRARNFRP